MKTKRITALLMAFAMIFSLLNASVTAQEATEEGIVNILEGSGAASELQSESITEEADENSDGESGSEIGGETESEEEEPPAAPTSIEITHDAKNIYNDVVILAQNDTFKLTAADQDGNETPVKWSTSSYGVTIDPDSGEVTVEEAMSVGGTSYWYFTATSTIDETVKKELRIIAAGYKFSSYDKARTITLSEDGQSVKTTSVSGGVNGYNIWTYDKESTVAAPNSEPEAKTSFSVKGLRPGSFDVSFKVDGNEELTDFTTIQVLGVAVEDNKGTLGKTYVGISRENPNPTVQLTAYVEEGSEILSWESSNEDVMSVDENGLVTVKNVGRAIISAIDINSKRGGIKVVAESEEVPYFESLEFLSNALTSGSWISGNTFAPTTFEYNLPIKNASASTLTLQAATLYDTEKYAAFAEYTDINGKEQKIEINSGKATSLANQPFDLSVMRITITDKNNFENKTVYTFNVSRPRDTSKAVKSGGITLAPVGRSVGGVLYDGVAEGAIRRADEEGNPASGSGASSSCKYYRTFVYDDIKSFKLNILSSTAYAHVRYSTDGGENWSELSQGGGATKEISLSEENELEVLIQIIDDAAYTNNVKAEIGGFDEGEVAEYKIWVDKVSLVMPEMLTATASHGDFYPEFDSGLNTHYIVVRSDEAAPTLTYSVSEGATVKIGTDVQTPDKNGNYTLELKTTQTSINVTSEDGMFSNVYKFSYSKKSKHDVPDKVVEYAYIGGQYTNGGYGIAPHATLSGSVKSLGNFGGYITYYYEEPITDNPNNKYGMDLYITGNSQERNIDSMAELGQVYVSEDGTEWYAIAGSEHYEDKAIWDYTITYTKDENGNAVWTDNYGNSIGNSPRAWPGKANYPISPIPDSDTYTFAGILFESQQGSIMGDSTNSSFAASAKFGYPDYYSSNISASEVTDVNPYVENPSKANGIDVKWAVDKDGNPIDVSDKKFHYIRIATASNIWAGSFFEKSTEIGYVVRTTPQESEVGSTEAPEGVVITDGAKSRVISFEEGKTVYDINLDDMKYITLAVSAASDEDNIYVNNQRLANGAYSKGFKVTKEEKTLVRIIVQNGEREPSIYMLRLSSGASESDELIENIKVNVSGSVREAETKDGKSYSLDVGYRVSEISIVPVINPEVVYTVNGGENSESYELEYGENVFEIEAEDESGNTQSVTLTVTRDSAPAASSRNITVYFTLYGDEKHGEEETHIYTDDKSSLPVWIEKTAYTVASGSTVLDVFEKALEANGLEWVNAGGNYISEIDGLAEFDNGALSGWMYLVDGEYSDLGLAEKMVKKGDNIVFHYTDDYTSEEASEGYTPINQGGLSGVGSNNNKKEDDNTEDKKAEEEKQEDKKQEDEKSESEEEKKSDENAESEKPENEKTDAVKFSDVKSDAWYFEAVEYAVKNNLMQGVGDTEFAPDAPMNRAMLVTVMYRMENSPEAADSRFKDVEADSYYNKAVSWAYENDIIEGINETEFAPDSGLTRQQIAAIMHRYARYKNKADDKMGDISVFADADKVSDWAISSVKWAYATGLIKGIDEDTLAPEDGATRAQVAQILMRFLNEII